MGLGTAVFFAPCAAEVSYWVPGCRSANPHPQAACDPPPPLPPPPFAPPSSTDPPAEGVAEVDWVLPAQCKLQATFTLHSLVVGLSAGQPERPLCQFQASHITVETSTQAGRPDMVWVWVPRPLESHEHRWVEFDLCSSGDPPRLDGGSIVMVRRRAGTKLGGMGWLSGLPHPHLRHPCGISDDNRGGPLSHCSSGRFTPPVRPHMHANAGGCSSCFRGY